jgi:hypothetical protein
LDERVTVAVDGVVVDLEDSVPARRSVGRVVVVMPDFVADTVAHLLAAGCDVSAESAPDAPGRGPLERELVAALFAASKVNGYRCPAGRVDWPRAATR